MAYPFIDLEKTASAKLIAHLAKQCGVEKDAETPRDQLVEAIIEFEEANNLSRPVDLLPADMRPVLVVEATAELPKQLEIPVRKHKKIKIFVIGIIINILIVKRFKYILLYIKMDQNQMFLVKI